ECPHCTVTKSMKHILLECAIMRQGALWDMARKLWERTCHEWIITTYRVVLGAMLIQIQMSKGARWQYDYTESW
ncbi:hypothetical protein DFS33DRAFT_1256803, partial [Desarmillaria ectypa]